MTFFGRINFITLTAAALVAVNGCSPNAQGQLDDEKEPHFGLGKSRINQMDYHGAVEAFQEAIAVNPRSAPAHFQLACLFDTKESDPAAAIYHYQQYLKFEPNARNGEVIRQRIESIFWTCKDLLTLERHGARTMAGLRERILSRFLCLAACISLNHRLGRPSRALVDYCA